VSDKQASKVKARTKKDAVKPKAGLIGAPAIALAPVRKRAPAAKEEDYAYA
jgi:hypothetical protein